MGYDTGLVPINFTRGLGARPKECHVEASGGLVNIHLSTEELTSIVLLPWQAKLLASALMRAVGYYADEE